MLRRDIAHYSPIYGSGHDEWNLFLFRKFKKKLSKVFTPSQMEKMNPYRKEKRNRFTVINGRSYKFPTVFEIFKSPKGRWKIILPNNSEFRLDDIKCDFYVTDIENGDKVPVNINIPPNMPNINFDCLQCSWCVPAFTILEYVYNQKGLPLDVDEFIKRSIEDSTPKEPKPPGFIAFPKWFYPVYTYETKDFQDMFEGYFCLPYCFYLNIDDDFGPDSELVIYVLDFTKIDDGECAIYTGTHNEDAFNASYKFGRILETDSVVTSPTDVISYHVRIAEGKMAMTYSYTSEPITYWIYNNSYIQYQLPNNVQYKDKETEGRVENWFRLTRSEKMPYVSGHLIHNYPYVANYVGGYLDENIGLDRMKQSIEKRSEMRGRINVIKRRNPNSQDVQ